MAKRHDKEFKVYAVKMVLEEGKKAAQVVRELDLAEQTLYNLIKKYREESESVFVGSGT